MADLHVIPKAKRVPSKDLYVITRAHLERAMEDFDAKVPHDFADSTDYDLVYQGRRYPPKAILGLAGKYALGRVLTHDDFSSGEDSACFRILRDRGFDVGLKPAPPLDFQIGQLYNRGEHIHQAFGGQMRGGICTPKRVPAIFLFTGKSGDQFGYVDAWSADRTVYSFAGEGQEGDMAMKGGNRAIRDHAADGKELHLFEALGKGQPIRYLGAFDYSGHREVPGVDKHGKHRKVLVFDLVPRGEFKPTADPEALNRMTRQLASKRWEAPPKGQAHPERVPQAQGEAIKRDPLVRAYVLHLANGICELCEQRAPFQDSDGDWYLEVHHVKQLAHGGPDTTENAVALCPNCHRAVHHAGDSLRLVQALYGKVGRILRP